MISNNQSNESQVQPGEFPFPLTRGPAESRFLTWLRNHANYMALRGLQDYMRMAAVLVRGILINSLVVLPTFLMIAFAFSLLYGGLLTDWNAQVTPGMAKRAPQLGGGVHQPGEEIVLVRRGVDALPGAVITSVPTLFDGLAELSAGTYNAVLAAAEPLERRPEAAVRTLRELAGDARLMLFGHPTLEILSQKMLQFGCDDYVITPAASAEFKQIFGAPPMRLAYRPITPPMKKGSAT